MKPYIFLLIASIILLSFSSKKTLLYFTKYSTSPCIEKYLTDTGNITILSFNSLRSENDSSKTLNLSTEDLVQIDTLLKAFLIDYNREAPSRQKGLAFSDKTPVIIENYCRQYIPYILKNEKIVFINCFNKDLVSELPFWRKFFVSVDGGGKAFFKVNVNLTTNKCFEFWINTQF